MGKRFDIILGLILTLVGVLGFFPNLTPGDRLFGLFMVDTAHNIVHLLSGMILLGVGFGGSEVLARQTALVFGMIYAIVTILGFLGINPVFGFIMVNSPDNILHLLISVSALAVGLAKQHHYAHR
jgi:hypothetical protein